MYVYTYVPQKCSGTVFGLVIVVFPLVLMLAILWSNSTKKKHRCCLNKYSPVYTILMSIGTHYTCIVCYAYLKYTGRVL